MNQRLIARIFAAIAVVVGAVGAAPMPPPAHWRVVLVAGDNAQPVFDNATRAVDLWLAQRGVAEADIHRLAADAGAKDPAVEPATLDRVLRRIAGLHAAPGEGCFVFITSHGGHGGSGIYLARAGEMLRPELLARALDTGCGAAPTVVVASACYSGIFAQGAMRAPNRIVLTAARADRPSFGCSAERTYTVYDFCLLGALPHATTWRGVYTDTRDCVQLRERQLGAQPSYPQASFGKAIRDLPLQF